MRKSPDRRPLRPRVQARNLPAHLCAGGVVFRFESGRPLAALVLEKGHKRAILPKGRVEPGELFETAARREIMEEAGLPTLHLFADLGMRQRSSYKGDAWKKVHYFLFVSDGRVCPPSDRNHRYSLLWADPENLPPMLWPEQEELVRKSLPKILDIRRQALKLRGIFDEQN